MPKIAVNVVLLLPKQITEKIIALNKKARKIRHARGLLGKRDFYPHLSLAMGILKKSDLNNAKKIISEICQNLSPFLLTSSSFVFSLKKDGTKSYVLKIRKTQKLQELHETLMEQLKPFFSYQGTAREVFKKKGEMVKIPDYLNQFRKKHSFQNYNPHITLRVKEVPVKNSRIKFTAQKLALCHVGVGTTCRKIILTSSLEK